MTQDSIGLLQTLCMSWWAVAPRLNGNAAAQCSELGKKNIWYLRMNPAPYNLFKSGLKSFSIEWSFTLYLLAHFLVSFKRWHFSLGLLQFSWNLFHFWLLLSGESKYIQLIPYFIWFVHVLLYNHKHLMTSIQLQV